MVPRASCTRCSDLLGGKLAPKSSTSHMLDRLHYSLRAAGAGSFGVDTCRQHDFRARAPRYKITLISKYRDTQFHSQR